MSAEQPATPMKLVVVGAAGRMGQTLIRVIHDSRAQCWPAPSNGRARRFIGRDAGETRRSRPPSAFPSPATPLAAFSGVEGVLDFTSPAATVEFAGLAAQARIVHVIGTTGCSAEDDAKIKAAARHARSSNPAI